METKVGFVHWLRLLRVATGFLTVLPLAREDDKPEEIAASSAFFPLVGLLIGGGVYGVFWVTRFVFETPFLPALLALAVWVVFTRGLHLDGLADVVDALGAPVFDREARESILKDPSLGTFGAIALFLVLSFKFFLFLETQNWEVILLAPLVARFFVLGIICFGRYLLRGSGLGSIFLIGPKGSTAFWVWLLVIATLLVLSGKAFLFLKICLCFVIIYSFARGVARILGFLNGDVMGAAIELGELLFLLAGRI
ncbi:MAG: adenosylcobinamide-GDP ribazoletransferase [Candidatus Atribacteria bacterium]|nr:adenosylcobinamide-GDP ribazoletransferase [Candidatus Atribacteria bacterium]MCD6349737.1 adenosylcobinamide-GDP ribazoletransferase [Candidatus Atribacteria bacterium]